MKKFRFFALFFLLSFGLFADVKESDLYYVRVKIVRAFMHKNGYYIIYRTSDMGMAEVAIPYSWFKPNDKRAHLVKSSGRIDPYLSLYTKNGEFSHIKVALPTEDPKNSVWGLLRAPSDYDSKFENVETIEFKY